MLKKLFCAFLIAGPLLAQGPSKPDPADEQGYQPPSGITYGKDPDAYNPTPRLKGLDSQVPTSEQGKGGSVKPQAWPSDKAFVEDKSLPFDVGTSGYGDFREANARACYAFLVAPGEKMEFKLKGAEEKVVMHAYVPNPPPALKWKLELDYINRIPRPRRSKQIEIKNNTKEPQTLFLVLYGVHGYAYRLDMTRSGGEKKS